MAQTQDGNVFADLSGTTTSIEGNPYTRLISECQEEAQLIQENYERHRHARNAQQKGLILSADFSGFLVDPILDKLLHKEVNPGYVDPRNVLVFWGRPPERIRDLVVGVQKRLLETAPSMCILFLFLDSVDSPAALWLMPREKLHMTTVEMAHSKTVSEIVSLVETMSSTIPDICNFTSSHHARLVKPLLGYDKAAIALSFVPAAGEPIPNDTPKTEHDDSYTYHHLRRDLYDLCESTGTRAGSRYVVPSAHLTIARFVDQQVYTSGNVHRLIETIEEINTDLQKKFWGQGPDGTRDVVQWVVGEGKGIECRKMRAWYGDGESHLVGQGTPSFTDATYKL